MSAALQRAIAAIGAGLQNAANHELIDVHVRAAERLHGDVTKVPIPKSRRRRRLMAPNSNWVWLLSLMEAGAMSAGYSTRDRRTAATDRFRCVFEGDGDALADTALTGGIEPT